MDHAKLQSLSERLQIPDQVIKVVPGLLPTGSAVCEGKHELFTSSAVFTYKNVHFCEQEECEA